MARTELGLRFLHQIPDTVAFAPKDSVLFQRAGGPALPGLPEAARPEEPSRPQAAQATGWPPAASSSGWPRGRWGPDIFLFGNFQYTKAWSTDRESGGDNPFARDPLNEITGVGGIGLKLNLNFWQRYEKVRKERIELKQLQKTEAYAAAGLLLKLQDEYAQLLNHRADMGESQKSLRAAEAWLKGAAMKYDLDPGAAKDMISPLQTVLGAKRDYFQAVLDYNLAVAKVIKSVGWTLTDYFRTLGTSASGQPKP